MKERKKEEKNSNKNEGEEENKIEKNGTVISRLYQ